MSWKELVELAGSDATMVEFINSQKTSSETLVSKINTLETTNGGLIEDIKKFKQGNTLVKDSLGLDVVNSETISEALDKLKSAKGDDKFLAEITNLKGLLETANNDKNTLTSDYEGKLSAMAMTNSLRDLGIGSIASTPIAEKMILEHLKNGAVLDGDNIVYKDAEGKTAYNGTNVLTPKDKLAQMQSSDDWKPFIKGDVSGGSGGRESSGGGGGTAKRSEMSPTQKAEYITANGSEAYLNLSN